MIKSYAEAIKNTIKTKQKSPERVHLNLKDKPKGDEFVHSADLEYTKHPWLEPRQQTHLMHQADRTDTFLKPAFLLLLSHFSNKTNTGQKLGCW